MCINCHSIALSQNDRLCLSETAKNANLQSTGNYVQVNKILSRYVTCLKTFIYILFVLHTFTLQTLLFVQNS